MHEAFPATVYTLCFGACLLCAFLLARGYARSRARLLLWSASCFGLLAANSALVIVDILVLPTIDFGVARLLLSLVAVAVLLVGFIWDEEA